MNVGPTSRGYFDQPRAGRAEGLRRLDEAATAAPSTAAPWPSRSSSRPPDCRFTQSEDGKRLYLHLFAYPFAASDSCTGLAGKVDYAQFLHDGSEVLLHRGRACEHFGEAVPEGDDLLVLELPPVKPNTLVPVIELFLK